jgi:predicted DCC family thiol-disulfide oxidoreductase YuxK
MFQYTCLPMAQQSTILYDRDCGFCRWSLAKVLAWDRGRQLRPVALQDAEADRLLDPMGEDRKMASWHLVDPEGRVTSGGDAAAPLLRLLPGGDPLALLAERLPGATRRAYGWVSENRSRLARPIRRRAVERADLRIEQRSS